MENNINQQYVFAEKIKRTKLKEWHEKVKKYVPHYTADFLFYKSGKIDEMLKFDENQGFEFDPQTVESSAETILLMLENIERNHPERARRLYSNFGNFKTRLVYLLPLLDSLDIYHAIERDVVSDLKYRIGELAEGSEEREICENRIRNIQTRAERERKEIESKNAKQPY